MSVTPEQLITTIRQSADRDGVCYVNVGAVAIEFGEDEEMIEREIRGLIATGMMENVSDVAGVTRLYKPLSDEEAARVVIVYYKERFRAVTGKEAVIRDEQKYRQRASGYAKQYGVEEMRKMVDAYLRTEDEFFRKNNWSLSALLNDNTIQKLI